MDDTIFLPDFSLTLNSLLHELDSPLRTIMSHDSPRTIMSHDRYSKCLDGLGNIDSYFSFSFEYNYISYIWGHISLLVITMRCYCFNISRVASLSTRFIMNVIIFIIVISFNSTYYYIAIVN